MHVARHNVAELWGQTHGAGRSTGQTGATQALARRSDGSGDLLTWVDQSGLSAKRLIVTGLSLAVAGAVGALILSVGFFGTVALGSMFTVGGGLVFLGARKLGRAASPPPPAALPPSRQALMHERSRRMHAMLQEGPATFERIVARLRWTEAAVLETLVFMKDEGLVVEDLDLDTGEWIYRLQENDYGTARGMTLDERRALAVDPESME
jgi:hypothetical protein